MISNAPISRITFNGLFGVIMLFFSRINSRVMVLLFIFQLFWVQAVAYQAECYGCTEAVFDSEQIQPRASIRGQITDIQTGEPIGWTNILIVETGRFTTSHEDGHFFLGNLIEGEFTVRTHRVGYESVTRKVNLTAGDTISLNIRLRASAFRSRAIEVIGERENGSEVQVERRVDGRELRQQLGRTLAETLQNEPGMSQSSMGPAPARPVMRGLSGDRLMVLEDGRTTGDISTSSPDHALAIDPINSNHIEILRGPAALVYSPNAMAGVVNVVRGQIPTEIPNHFHGTASIQGETVNQGLSTGISSFGSIKNVGIRGDFGLRNATDIQTPIGKLQNTAIQNIHGALGASHVHDWGLYGASANFYRSSYGIPGNFTGSHPEGVKINLQRQQVDARFDRSMSFAFLRRIVAEYTFSHYYHEELEFDPATSRHDLIGSEYSLFTHTMNLRVFNDKSGPFDRGIFGGFAEISNFTAGGLTFTPETDEYNLAMYSYQQIRRGDWDIQLGARLDAASVRPVRPTQTSFGHRRQRDFVNASGGISAVYRLSNPLSTGVSVMRTVRMPGVEELFTEGPHLPAYSFEVGNPDLNEEIGHGLEWNIRFATDRFGFRNAWYVNHFSNYLYPRNTGQMSARRPLPIYQISGDEVRMWGAEWMMEVELSSVLSLDATVSYVEGTILATNEPLPFIPPLSGKVDLQYSNRKLTVGTSSRIARKQDRLGEFEEPTDGYIVFDAFAQYFFTRGNYLHTFSFTVENISDQTYRMHLSRVKSIMPEPGRNLKFLYRVYF